MKIFLIGLMLIVATPALAQQTFDKMWEERILSMVRLNTRAPTPVVTAANETPEEEEEPPPPKREQERDQKKCLTLKEARRVYGNKVYLSWRGRHCWFRG